MVVIELRLNNGLIRSLKNNTLGVLGYNIGVNLDPVVEKTLDEALQVATEVVRPKGMYHVLPVLRASKTGVETRIGIIDSAKFARFVGMCRGNRSIVFMLVTIGEEFERIGRAKESLFHQLVYDAIGSELTEIIADLLEMNMRGRLKSVDLQLSWRFSPGYCDWPLSGQDLIFTSLDSSLIGVRLTPNFVMEPNKSISAVAAAAQEVLMPAPCAFCAKKDCLWRRLPRGGKSDHHNDRRIATISKTSKRRSD